MTTQCSDCGRQWSGYSECHCRKCHRHFGGLAGFDAHFKGNEHTDPPSFSKEGRPLFHLMDKKYGKAWVTVHQEAESTPISSSFSDERSSGSTWTTPMDEKRLKSLTSSRKRASA